MNLPTTLRWPTVSSLIRRTDRVSHLRRRLPRGKRLGEGSGRARGQRGGNGCHQGHHGLNCSTWAESVVFEGDVVAGRFDVSEVVICDHLEREATTVINMTADPSTVMSVPSQSNFRAREARDRLELMRVAGYDDEQKRNFLTLMTGDSHFGRLVGLQDLRWRVGSKFRARRTTRTPVSSSISRGSWVTTPTSARRRVTSLNVCACCISPSLETGSHPRTPSKTSPSRQPR